MGAALGLLLIAVVAVLIVRPLWRPALEPMEEVAGPASELADLEQRKQAIYGSIRDLGFDFRTGKLVEEDYRDEAERLKAEAVEVVARIEELRSSPPRAEDEVEGRIAALRRQMAPDAAGTAGDVAEDERTAGAEAAAGEVRFCPRCGRGVGESDRFCAGCGHELPGRS